MWITVFWQVITNYLFCEKPCAFLKSNKLPKVISRASCGRIKTHPAFFLRICQFCHWVNFYIAVTGMSRFSGLLRWELQDEIPLTTIDFFHANLEWVSRCRDCRRLNLQGKKVLTTCRFWDVEWVNFLQQLSLTRFLTLWSPSFKQCFCIFS